VVQVLVVYDRCRPLGEGGGYSLVWPTQGCAAGQGMVFYLPPRPPPLPPPGAENLEMTTDAQEGNNKTLQGLINTMQSHSVVMRFWNKHDILLNHFYLWFKISSTTSNQRQPWKLFYQQGIKKTFSFKGPMSIHSTPSRKDTIGTVTMCLS